MGDLLARELGGIVGERHVLTDPDLRAQYEVDWTSRFRGEARLVVRPADLEEVAAVVRACAAAGAAVVPQGGNTGLVGGSVPRGGEVVLSTARLTGITIDAEAAQAVAGAGTTIADLHAAADAAGLTYGVDLASRDSATVGGTVATNAGGLNVVRNGPTREQLMGVEAVLADGTVLRRMGGLPKDATGYELPALLCGSEGTLAIITAARLRLRPRPAEHAVVLLGLSSISDALAVLRSVRAVPSLAAIEFFHGDGLDLVVRHAGVSPPFRASFDTYVVVACAGLEDPLPELAQAVERLTVPYEAAVATSRSDREALWVYRERQTEAVHAEGPIRKLDVGLPLPELARFEDEARRICADANVRIIMFGHLAEGNVHVELIGGDHADDVEDRILRLVASLGGSISAEHGVGIAKAAWLHLTREEGDRAAMRAVKAAFDPSGLLNPGVLLA